MDRYEAKLLKSTRAVSVPPGTASPPAFSAFKSLRSGPAYRFFPDGTVQQRSESPVRSRARVFDLGAGQVEAIVQPVHDWVECDPMEPAALAAALAAHAFPHPLTPAQLLEKASLNEDRSCRRAKTRVRRIAKFKQLDTMLTLTYGENQTDRTVAQRHLAAFLRRVKRVIPEFEYLAVPEQQKRGAWHWHIAVRQLKSGYWVRGTYVHSWKLLRAVWRSVIAGPGNIDVQARGKPGRSVHQLSSYLTKYISKGFTTSGMHQNRYQSSAVDLPKALVFDIPLTGLAANGQVQLLFVPEWSGLGRWHTSAPLASGGYFLCLTPNG